MRLIQSKTGRIYKYDYPHPRTPRKLSIHHPDFKYQDPSTNEILRRTTFRCEICAATNRRLYIHHKDELGYSKTNTPNNNHANLLIVCAKCHMQLHKIGVFPDIKVIIQLRTQGYTLRRIGEVFGLSKQRIHQLLKKNILEND